MSVLIWNDLCQAKRMIKIIGVSKSLFILLNKPERLIVCLLFYARISNPMHSGFQLSSIYHSANELGVSSSFRLLITICDGSCTLIRFKKSTIKFSQLGWYGT